MSRAIIQQLLISWQADDPDSDKLVYEVAFRGEGESQWKTLRRDLHDNALALDGDSLADGRYYFKIIASDREANPPGAAREMELVSSPVLIDNTPPVIRVQSSSRTGNIADVVFDAQDTASALRRAEWSLDAGDWQPIAPVDGILDSKAEQFRLHVDNIPAGEHVLVSASGGFRRQHRSCQSDNSLKRAGRGARVAQKPELWQQKSGPAGPRKPVAQKTLERVLSKPASVHGLRPEAGSTPGRFRSTGRSIENPDHWVDFERDRVLFEGKPLTKRRNLYVLLYKPTGYITTFKDPEGRPTVYDLIERSISSSHPSAVSISIPAAC